MSKKLLWSLGVLLIALTSGEGVGVTVGGPVEKSPLDEKEYRVLTLPNRLQVLLIRDLNATKAAASLTVGAGSLNNPVDLPGLAHFVEHAVYLGDKKYPEENGLSKYLAANGGSDNALTYEDYTTYYFDVAPDALNGTLDRFGQLFISPLFRESSLEKEVNAINSENEKNIPSDSRRIFRVERETANKSHDLSRFITGSRETLWTLPRARGVNMSVELDKFFQKYYSANIMRLAVLGPQSLDDLQKTVEDIFSAIPDKDVEMPVWRDPPYGPEELQRWIRIVPQSDIRSLYFTVPVPYSLPTYKTNPLGYVTSLIGHEAKGSVLSLLKERNLATALETGSWENRGFTAMRVQVALTPEGLNNTEEVVCLLFRYIDMLRTAGSQEWYWREQQAIHDIGFRFKDKTEATSLLTSYSSKMLTYPLEETITAGFLFKEYNESAISEILSLITPERVRVTVLSKSFEPTANITEKYYGVKYSTEKIDPEVIKRWGECKKVGDLHMPQKNEFIPAKLELKERVKNPGIVPIVLKETPLSRVWFLQDSEFNLPKAIVSLEMFSPQAYLDPLSVWLTHMMTELVDDALAEFYYDAYLTDLSYSLSSFPYGIRLRVDGFDDKLGVLLHKTLDTLTSFNFSDVDPSRFESFKDSYLRKLRNHENDQPKETAKTFLSLLLRDEYWAYDDLLSVAEDVTIDRVARHAEIFFARLKFQWLFYGNVLPQESLRLAEENEALFTNKVHTRPLLPSQIIRLRDVEIPQGSEWIHEMKTTAHSSSAVILLQQLGAITDAREVVMAELLDQLTHQLFYDQLRTQEQLGYTVGTTTRSFEATKAFQFVVQGERHPAYVNSRIQAFVSSFAKIVANMTEETFKGHKESFRAVLAASKPKTQFERYSALGKEIVSERLNFESEVRQREALDKLTLAEFQEFFTNNFLEGGKNRRTVLVNVLSVAEGGAGRNVSESDAKLAAELASSRVPIGDDVSKWKKQRKLFPIY